MITWNAGFNVADDVLRIYVASISDYNSGRIHGAWIDATQDLEEILSQIQEMLDSSREPGAEEYAVHDYDGIPCALGEYPDLATVVATARLIEAHGEPARMYLEIFPESLDSPDNLEMDFLDCYLGRFDRRGAYAEQSLDDSGELQALPERLWDYFDFERFENDLIDSGAICQRDHYYFFNQ